MMSRIQKVINKLTLWGEKTGLKFNPSKTVSMIFTKKHLKQWDLPNKLLINNERVPFSDSTRYLGVMLDNKLNWSNQWSKVIKQAKQYLFMIIPKLSKKFGPQPKYVKWIYTAIIRPRIMYAFFTWGHSIGQGQRLKDLEHHK